MDLVKVIGCVINLSADDMLHPISGQLLDDALMESSNVADMSFSFEKKRERILSIMPTEYLIEKLDALGAKWEQSWPCRGLFFRALLAISSLNRIVKWYSVVRSTFNEDIIGRLDKQTHTNSSAGGLPESIVLTNDISPSVDTKPSNPLGTSHSSKIPKDFTHSTVSDSTTAEKANLSNNVGLCHDGLSHRPKDMATSSATALKACSTSHPSEQSVDKRLALDTAVFDKSFNMLLEVSLDGRIRYISPTCRQLLGASPESIVDLPAAAIFEAEGIQLCHSAVEQLLADGTRTVEINIKVHAPGSSSLVDVEAKGMLIYSRSKRLP
ncbi:rim15, signal transduction response regulator, partial [Coemansia sp. BCRC 34490]